MATNRHQRQPNPGATLRLCALVLSALVILVSGTNSYAEEPTQEIEAPDNWYQVEVILFTQSGNTGGEAPPQEYDLSFPENWLELVDPNMPLEEDGFPLAAGSLLYQSPLGDSSRLIPMAAVTDPLITPEQSQAPNIDPLITPEHAPPAELEDLYIPQYESPFALLDKEFRDLNESAAALERRQYNVVFHEAWRFAADENGTDPWVLIKAGQRLEGRFQLEGSIRFYKSRFLHFQSDLWLLQFSNASLDEPPRLIDLPELPLAPIIPEISAIEADTGNEIELKNGFNSEIVSKVENVIKDEFENYTEFRTEEQPGLEDYSINTDTLDSDPNTALSERIQPTAPGKSLPKKYPVETVWVLNKSKRIEEQTIYYIDHPEMGIMVTIKPFTPELLNPPEQELEPTATKVVQDASPQG